MCTNYYSPAPHHHVEMPSPRQVTVGEIVKREGQLQLKVRTDILAIVQKAGYCLDWDASDFSPPYNPEESIESRSHQIAALNSTTIEVPRDFNNVPRPDWKSTTVASELWYQLEPIDGFYYLELHDTCPKPLGKLTLSYVQEIKSVLVHLAAQIAGTRAAGCGKCDGGRTRVLMYSECLTFYKMEDGVCSNCLFKHRTTECTYRRSKYTPGEVYYSDFSRL